MALWFMTDDVDVFFLCVCVFFFFFFFLGGGGSPPSPTVHAAHGTGHVARGCVFVLTLRGQSSAINVCSSGLGTVLSVTRSQDNYVFVLVLSLSVCLSVCLCVSVSLFSVCVSLSLCISLSFLSPCLSLSLSLYHRLDITVQVSGRKTPSFSVCLSVCLSVSHSVSLFVSASLSIIALI